MAAQSSFRDFVITSYSIHYTKLYELLNVFAHELDLLLHDQSHLQPAEIFAAIQQVHKQIRGAYAVVSVIIEHGLVAFRDPNGIRPLVIGRRLSEEGGIEYMVASESVSLDVLGFDLMRDVEPA